MAKKAKGISIVVLVGLAVVVWWYLTREQSPSAALAADVAGGKMPTIPSFGTDNIIDTADAIAATGSLPLPTLTLSPSTTAMNSSQ